jgi:REP element-mobilizing transposase RayT
MVSRSARPELDGRWPVHVTMRVLPEIPSLRVLNAPVKRALFAGANQPGFRIVHFSILGNHLHLIIEADTSERLSRGMQGIAVRISHAVNRGMSRKRGKVFSDRFHEHVLRTLREVKAAIHYVVENYRKHRAEAGRPVSARFVDPHSSAALEPHQLPSPEFWLTRTG